MYTLCHYFNKNIFNISEMIKNKSREKLGHQIGRVMIQKPVCQRVHYIYSCLYTYNCYS